MRSLQEGGQLGSSIMEAVVTEIHNDCHVVAIVDFRLQQPKELFAMSLGAVAVNRPLVSPSGYHHNTAEGQTV